APAGRTPPGERGAARRDVKPRSLAWSTAGYPAQSLARTLASARSAFPPIRISRLPDSELSMPGAIAVDERANGVQPLRAVRIDVTRDQRGDDLLLVQPQLERRACQRVGLRRGDANEQRLRLRG